jgi:hypothetical protein
MGLLGDTLGPGKSPTPEITGVFVGGIGVGGMGVAVGRYVAVGGIGWNGVAVVVGSSGENNKFRFMLTAAGPPFTGKLQAGSNHSKMIRISAGFNLFGEVMYRMVSTNQYFKRSSIDICSHRSRSGRIRWRCTTNKTIICWRR